MTPDRRDPDDPDTPGEPTAADIDAAFAQIIAGWEADERSRWPGDDPAAEPPTPELAVAHQDGSAQDTAAPGDPTDAPADLDDPDDLDNLDDHFVPPDPPPLPRPHPTALGAGALFLLGLVLLTVPWIIGFSAQYGLPLGLLSITGSLVWLGTLLRQGPPTDSGWDDGAQV